MSGTEKKDVLDQFVSQFTEWKDDDRMRVLFAPFPDPLAQANAYKDKLRFWKELVLSWCRRTHKVVISASEIQSTFKRKGITPLCIGTLCEELEVDKTLQTYDDFKANVKKLDGASYSSWAIGAVSSGVGWLLGRGSVKKSRPLNTQFIVIPILKEKAEEIFNDHKKERMYPSDDLAPLSHLSKYINNIVNNENDLRLVVDELALEKSAPSFEFKPGEKAVKFARSYGMGVRVDPLVDKGIISIKETLESIKNQIAKLNSDIAECTKEALAANRTNQKAKALLFMKRKKKFEEIQVKRMNVSDTLQEVMTSIQNTETDKEVMEAYRSGIETIEAMTTKAGFTAETVDVVMDQLNDVLADQREIDEAFKQGYTQLNVDVDDEEIERELNKLIEESLPSTANLPTLLIPTADTASPQKAATASPTKTEDHDDLNDMLSNLSLQEKTTATVKSPEKQLELAS